METPIVDYLIEHMQSNPVSFHMPGHKGSAIYKRFGYENFINKMMDCDITEIIGADNLFKAEGIIREAQERYSFLYDVRKSYFLVNGTSGGIIASILATVPEGKKIVMARNCHKSVFNALTLKNIEPLYVYPKIIEKHCLTGEISSKDIEKILCENKDAEAVILPSPNYYGICSDIEEIAKTVHEAGKILIVDQAHGAHLKFFSSNGISGFPKSAEEQGADIVINSIHKTLASFTQSAVLNLNSDRVKSDVLEDKLQVIESSSPSYLMMASLDINGSLLMYHGKQLMEEWKGALEFFYQEAQNIEGLTVLGSFKDSKKNLMDLTKINLDMSSLGIDGAELEEQLLKYNIFLELTTGNIAMCMTGVGTTMEDVKKLIFALEDIAGKARGSMGDLRENRGKKSQIVNRRLSSKMQALEDLELCDIPKEKKRMLLKDSAGKVCANSIIPYPPGIPIVCPGERLTKEIIEHIKSLSLAGEKIIGINEDGEIFVGK